jgi:hypothetical protein
LSDGLTGCTLAQLRSLQASHDFQERLQSARAQLGELRTSTFVKRAVRSAELLHVLAAALANAPQGRDQDVASLCDMKQQAEGLLSSESSPFQHCARIKRGLYLAVDVLQRQAQRIDPQRLQPWLDSARRAVQSIDEQSMVSFQGSEIQDAFRTTVDVLTVLSRTSGR